MLTFLERNSKDRYRSRLGAISGGAKINAAAAAEAVLDSVPASGTMTQHEVNEVSSLSATMWEVNFFLLMNEQLDACLTRLLLEARTQVPLPVYLTQYLPL